MDGQTQYPPADFIFFYGKGGAGKDTEGEKLQTELSNSAIISTGDEIKRARDPNHPFHSLVAPYEHLIDQGKNLPMEVVINLEEPRMSIFPAFIMTRLQEGVSTIISTGFPRTMEQLDALRFYLRMMTLKYDIRQHHIWLDVSDETVRERIEKRRLEYRFAGKDPRSDDTPENVERRLQVFREDTLPLIRRLDEQGKLISVDANGTKDEVHRLVEDALGLKRPLEIIPEDHGPNPERL